MKVLIAVCMCAGLSVAQHNLPNYFQGSFNIPNAPIPTPGSYAGSPSSPAAHMGTYQAQPQAAAPQSGAWSPAAYGGAPSAAPASYAPQAAPAQPAHVPPSNYGWNVQHSIPSPPQPQPQQPQPHSAPAYAAQPRPAAAAPQYQQYTAPQPQYAAPQPQYQQYAASQPQYAAPQAQYSAPQAPQHAPQYAQPAAAAAAAVSNPVANALLRPASVHYANIGETLNGDYKFGYRTGNGDSFREEARAPDGSVQGQYGFTDADGKQRIVKYSAGVNGFQVLNDGANPAAAAASAPAAGHSSPWGQTQGYPAAAAPAQSWASQQPQRAAPQQQWG